MSPSSPFDVWMFNVCPQLLTTIAQWSWFLPRHEDFLRLPSRLVILWNSDARSNVLLAFRSCNRIICHVYVQKCFTSSWYCINLYHIVPNLSKFHHLSSTFYGKALLGLSHASFSEGFHDSACIKAVPIGTHAIKTWIRAVVRW